MAKGSLKRALEQKTITPEERAKVYERLAESEPAEQTKRLNAEIPVSLHKRFKEKAVELDTSMSELLRIILDAWLEE